MASHLSLKEQKYIRDHYGKKPVNQIARDLQRPYGTVNWFVIKELGHTPKKREKITNQTLQAIKRMLDRGESVSQIALHLNISRNTVGRVKNGTRQFKAPVMDSESLLRSVFR